MTPFFLSLVVLFICKAVSDFFVTPWTVAHQAPWDTPGKKTGVRFHFFLQGIYLTQGSKPHFLHWQADSLPPSYQGSPSLSLTTSKSTTPLCFYLLRVSSILIYGHYLSSSPSFHYCWSFLVFFFVSNIVARFTFMKQIWWGQCPD